MSLLNDALIKAERDRADAASADLSHLDGPARAARRAVAKRVQSLRLIVVNAALLLAVFAVVIVVLLRNRPVAASGPVIAETSPAETPPPPRPDPAGGNASDTVEPAAVAASAIEADESPFLGETSLPPPPARPAYELSGMSAIGQTTLLSVVRTRDQRSVWIPVGQSVGEITALSYDETSETALIEVAGRPLSIRMRTGPAPETSGQAE